MGGGSDESDKGIRQRQEREGKRSEERVKLKGGKEIKAGEEESLRGGQMNGIKEGRDEWEKEKGAGGEGKLRLMASRERQENQQVMTTTALTRNKAQLFPTTRRPGKREIPNKESVAGEEVEKWFKSTSLRLGEQLSDQQRAKAVRLLYTWRDVFETDLL